MSSAVVCTEQPRNLGCKSTFGVYREQTSIYEQDQRRHKALYKA